MLNFQSFPKHCTPSLTKICNLLKLVAYVLSFYIFEKKAIRGYEKCFLYY